MLLAEAGAPVEVGGLGVEELHVGTGVDEAPDVLDDVVQLPVALGYHRHRDGGPLPLSVVVDLGDGQAVPVAQPLHDGADGGALGLQRPAGRHMEVEADRGRVHGTIFALSAGRSVPDVEREPERAVELVSLGFLEAPDGVTIEQVTWESGDVVAVDHALGR